ncbi:deoxyguanosinetriphosphate triphosphohydrolase, partial [Mesorhizobium sp. M2D.F.Ca.ET.145.01.1.1]
AVSLPGTILKSVRERYPRLDDVRTGHELMRRQITAMVEDVIKSTTANLERIRPLSVEAVRAAGETMVTFSAEMAEAEKELKAFLYK